MTRSKSLRSLWCPLALILGLSSQGCLAQPGPEDGETVDSDSAALTVEATTLTGVALELDGIAAGNATSLVVDEAGEVHITFIADEASPLFEHTVHELSQAEGSLVQLRAQGTEASKGVQEVELVSCLMKEVSFSDLDAKDGKKLLKVTVTFAPTEVKYSNGNGAVIKGALSHTVTPSLDVPGLPSDSIGGFTFTAKRQPTKNYAAWSVEGLKVSGSDGYASAEAIVAAGLPVEITLSLTDESTGAVTDVSTTGKFTTGAEAKGGEDKPMQWTIDVIIEGQTITIGQKA